MKRQQAKMEINLVKFRRGIRKHHLEAKLYVLLEAVRSELIFEWICLVVGTMDLRKTLGHRGQGQETESYSQGYENRGQTVKTQHMDNYIFEEESQNTYK